MAMVRTIQHPGVQIQETEIGSYSSTIVMNNAYIMGYADRGPIYDYSWIMNTRDFTKIYGEPQNEAEKYLFTAVQSVLANGGTPIVARMPYDNKQCKAYKALKMKWSDVTPLVDTDLASPIVPLSAVAGEINMNKSFKEIFTTDSVTVNDSIVDDEYIKSLTLSQMLKQLNPYKNGSEKSGGDVWEGFEFGLKLNGVYPSSLCIDQIAVSSILDSVAKDQVKLIKKAYQYDEGYNVQQYETINGLVNSFVTDNHEFYEVHDLYFELIDNKAGLSAYVNMYGDSTEDYNGFPVYLPEAIPSGVGTIIMKNRTLSGFFTIQKTLKGDYDAENSKFNVPTTASEVQNMIRNEHIVAGEIVGYFDFDTEVDFPVVTKVNQKMVYTQQRYGAISRYLTPAKVNSVIDKDSFLMMYPKTKDGEINGLPGTDLDVTGKALADGIERITKVDTLDRLFPIYANTLNGFPCNENTGEIDGTAEFYTAGGADGRALVGFYNLDVESPAITGLITIDGHEYPVYSKKNIGKFVHTLGNNTEAKYIDLEKTGTFAFNEGNYAPIVTAGEVEFTYCNNIPYTGFLDDISIVDITDEIISENEFLVWVKTIYNSVKFMRLSQANMAKLEASLMMTPEMGFKYGLYLDSEECEISNDQYDDLVTVNQFKAVDRTIDKYGHDIDDANFIIVDKQKTVVQGVGGNIGFFTTVIDPFDALKVQRLLINPAETISSNRVVKVRDENGNIISTKTVEFDHSDANITRLDYWAYEAADSWNKIYDELLDSMDCLQRVRNADGIYVGEPNPVDGKLNILDSWAVPLTGTYYDESISKTLMRKFPGIAMADIDSSSFDDENYVPSVIDHQYATHIMVAVCKTTIDQATGKIVVTLVETFFGSLFNEVSVQNGRSLFIGDIINGNSDYIEFYRNNYVNAGDAGAYDPPEYRRTPVNQIFIKESTDLKNAAQLRGIDADDYALDSPNAAVRAAGEAAYLRDLAKKNIYVIDKKEVCVYNLHWEANFTSFSRKESQKIIANTSGLYSVSDGTTINVAKNFLVDMDRCINFIKNRDDLPLHFVCDAGLSTIAQFCDNVIWNPNKMTVVGEEIDPVTKKKTGKKVYTKTGGWITQPFSPDDDPDGEDRYITGYADVATWRKVAEKIDSICSDVRKDCFAIIDAPRQLTLDGAAPKIRRTKFNNNFDKSIGRCLRFISGFNSSYSAGYYNWLRTTDQYTGKAIWIPPTSKIIGNYCYLNINNLPWLAPAGLTYGLISGCHAISHNPNYQEEDQIYMKSWNYIKQYPVEGFVIEGQKTLLGKESVFERVNVRLLFLDLERFAYNVSRTFKYTVNNTYTREQFVATLKPKFEDYTLRGGIYEYLIKVDSENNTPETIDANELRGDIFIKPARLIEYILLNFVGTTTGTDFNELPMG